MCTVQSEIIVLTGDLSASRTARGRSAFSTWAGIAMVAARALLSILAARYLLTELVLQNVRVSAL